MNDPLYEGNGFFPQHPPIAGTSLGAKALSDRRNIELAAEGRKTTTERIYDFINNRTDLLDEDGRPVGATHWDIENGTMIPNQSVTPIIADLRQAGRVDKLRNEQGRPITRLHEETGAKGWVFIAAEIPPTQDRTFKVTLPKSLYRILVAAAAYHNEQYGEPIWTPQKWAARILMDNLAEKGISDYWLDEDTEEAA